MGYTHYWTFLSGKAPKQYNEALNMIGHFIRYAQEQGYELANGHGKEGTTPETHEDILFNGVEDDAYETFMITKEYHQGFNFCKTNRRPYDAVVVGSLILLKGVLGSVVEINSDGKGDVSAFNEAFRLLFDYMQTLIKESPPEYSEFCRLCLALFK